MSPSGQEEQVPAALDGHFDFELENLARELGARLRQVGGRLVTAESCTGGWLSAAVTSVSGSSNWFALGVSTYSNAAKTQLLGVPAALIRKQGAVSEPVVQAMVEGALRLEAGATLAVAVSGVAGPGPGGNRRAGTVFIAWGERGKRPVSRGFGFAGDRNQVRRASVHAALKGCIEVLQ